MRTKIYSLIVALAAVLPFAHLSHAETAPVTGKIIDGTLTPVSDFPYVAQMSLGDFTCTGTLIASKYVLTAAHCFFDENNKQIKDVSGFGAVLNGTLYKAAKVTVHPSYVSRSSACVDGERDAAIMELVSAPVGITPIEIKRTTPTVGTSLLLVGFGTQGTGNGGEDGTFPTAGFVRYGTTSIESVDSSYVNWTFNSGSGEANTAGGDSGGPAFTDVGGIRYIDSITCGGTGNAGFNTTSSNTRGDVIASWADSITGATAPNQPPAFVSLPAQTVGVNQAFTYQVQVSGTGPITLNVQGELPPGLTFDGANITGIPTTVGTYNVSFAASNAAGSATGVLTIYVTSFNPDSALTINSVRVDFEDEDEYLIAIKGKIEVGKKFAPKKSVVKIAIAQLSDSFKLDAQGGASRKKGFDFVKLSGKISKGKFAQSKVGFSFGLGDKPGLYDKLDSIFPIDAENGAVVSLPIQILINGVTYDRTVSMKYNAGKDIWTNVK